MKKFISLIIKFFKKPIKEQLLYIEVIFWLSVTRLVILVLPFKIIARFLGKHMAESDRNHDLNCMDEVKLVVSSILSMSRHLPWECKCLVQAISGKMMLGKRKISNTLYFGVAKDEDRGIIAHAWLRVGEVIILGGGGLDQFAVVSTFSSYV